MDNNPPAETNAAIETEDSNPFDGRVTDHSMAWSHVTAAYGISLGILFTYIAVVSFRLRSARTQGRPKA